MLAQYPSSRARRRRAHLQAWLVVIAACVSQVTGTAAASSASYDEIMAGARAALGRGDAAAAGEALDAAQQLRPYSMYLTRNRIATRALAGRVDDALALATEIAARGLALDLTGEPFAVLRDHPGYAAVAQRFAANLAPRGTGTVVFEASARELLPEALLADDGGWLVGTVRTGAVLRTGSPLSKVATLNGGVFDLERRGGLLIAAVNNQLAYAGTGEAPPKATVVEIRAASGEVQRSAFLEGDALFGDIEVATDGSVYASDSLTPRVMVLRPGSDQLAEVTTDPRLVNLQGLALDERRRRLFVADYLVGLFAIDPATGAVTAITSASGAHLGGIDGLYLYRGDLVAIQNGVSPQRIVRLRLDPPGLVVTGLDVLQQSLPEWNEPTHGTVVGDEFFYIATSNWPAYGDDGQPVEPARLAPLRIMSVALN